MISAELLGCSTSRNKGTYANRLNIRRLVLEDHVLRGLESQLMSGDLFEEFCAEFARETNRLRATAQSHLNLARAEIAKIDRDLDRLVDLILRGGAADRLNEKMLGMERRKKELELHLASAKQPGPTLYPKMATLYRERVAGLRSLLDRGTDVDQLAAREAIRSLISAIILTPEDGALTVAIQGDLADILTAAAQTKSPAVSTAGPSQLAVVAGTGFEPVTFRL